MNGRVLASVVPMVLLLVGGCGSVTGPESRPPAATASAAPADSAAPSRAVDDPAASFAAPPSTVRAYFYLGGEPGSDGLVPVEREVPGDDPRAGALAALLAGPTATESGDRTITSAVPAGTRLLALLVADGVATVDLSHEFETGGGSLSMFARLGQVVFTLTQFDDIEAVAFKIEGQRVSVFGGEGIVLDHPQTRADSEGVLPAIFVDAPAYAAALGNPGRVAGTASVFEARFRITLLDAAGRTIADVPATATCGTGCRGEFDVTVPYEVDRAQIGTLRAWDGSMKDGRPANVREYPIGLVPGG
jgi:germination protein M